MPDRSCTVRTRQLGPPMTSAALIRPLLPSHRSTHRSRGKASIAARRPCTLRMKIVSVRASQPCPSAGASATSSLLSFRSSEPTTRMLSGEPPAASSETGNRGTWRDAHRGTTSARSSGRRAAARRAGASDVAGWPRSDPTSPSPRQGCRRPACSRWFLSLRPAPAPQAPEVPRPDAGAVDRSIDRRRSTVESIAWIGRSEGIADRQDAASLRQCSTTRRPATAPDPPVRPVARGCGRYRAATETRRWRWTTNGRGRAARPVRGGS
jgi:hypothetical protein